MTNILISQVDYMRSINKEITSKNIIRTKINNSRYSLTRFRNARKNSDLGSHIRLQQHQIKKIGSSLQESFKDPMLIEASAARHYWECVRYICKQGPEWNRAYPGAFDPLNLSLNIGYTFLLRLCKDALKKAGLETSLAILHSSQHAEGLVYDFMEPFRNIVVDTAIFPLFSRGQKKVSGGKIIARIQARLLEKYPYEGENISLHRLIEREAYALKKAIEMNVPWKPFSIQWGNSRKRKCRPAKIGMDFPGRSECF